MIKENQKYLNRILIVLDGLCVLGSLILAWIIRFKFKIIPVAEGYLTFREYIKPVLFAVPIYLIIYGSFKLYTPYRFKKTIDEFINIFRANLVGILVFILILFALKIIDYSRYLLVVFLALSIITMTLERTIMRSTLRKLRKSGYNQKHIVIVGLSETTEELLLRIERNAQWGYEVAGILDDNRVTGSKLRGKEILGKIEKLESVLNNEAIDEVFITIAMNEYDKLRNIIEICEKTGVRTNIIPGYYKYIPARPYLEEIDGLPIINIRYVPLDNILNRTLKRIIDIIGALVAIILSSPVLLSCAAIIKLTSPGPVLFEQERVGLNKKPFVMLKFRSMHVQKDEEEKVKWTTENDPRKTKFGSFIRKTSIDELPQFFNVLRGDMSLVGPRPERPFFVEQFKEEIPKYMIKHQVRPGITGWAQVNGWRGDTSIKRRIECDLYYIENWSLWFDIKIMWLTVFKGFVNKNAY